MPNFRPRLSAVEARNGASPPSMERGNRQRKCGQVHSQPAPEDSQVGVDHAMHGIEHDAG